MADSGSPATAVLEALGFALFLRDDAEQLRLQGNPPLWLRELWSSLTSEGDALPVADASPFLENFLIDAEDCWKQGDATRARSGPWIEQSANKGEVSLEATALTIDGRGALLLERLSDAFEVKKSMLQKARETVIAYQRLNAETQKKEILLSCIAEEMNSALANAVTALRLIEMEKHSARAQQLLALAMRATEDQQVLINKVLTVFATELASLYGRRDGEVAQSPLDEGLARAIEATAPALAEKRVQLHPPNETKALLAIGKEQLERVLANLLENALQNSPAGGEITVRAATEAETVLLEVIDRGAVMAPSAGSDVFSRETMAKDEGAAKQLPLQFCRMTVENCQGEFGSEASEKGGNRCWIRLPKVRAASAP